ARLHGSHGNKWGPGTSRISLTNGRPFAGARRVCQVPASFFSFQVFIQKLDGLLQRVFQLFTDPSMPFAFHSHEFGWYVQSIESLLKLGGMNVGDNVILGAMKGQDGRNSSVFLEIGQ